MLQFNVSQWNDDDDDDDVVPNVAIQSHLNFSELKLLYLHNPTSLYKM